MVRKLKSNIIALVLIPVLFLPALYEESMKTALAQPAQSVIQVLPSNVTVTVGKNFNVSINLLNVTDFYCVQYELTWDPDLLTVVDFFEGDLMRDLGQKSFFIHAIYSPGYAILANTFLGPEISVGPSTGAISVAEFRALNVGSSFLNVSGTPYEQRGAAVVIQNATGNVKTETPKILDLSNRSAVPPIRQSTVLKVGPGYPYSTITDALIDAMPGDKIHVYPGTYTESLIVDKTHVALIGQGEDTVTIRAPDQSSTVVEIVADNVTITGFTIQDGYGGIVTLIRPFGSLNVRGNTFKNNHVAVGLVGSGLHGPTSNDILLENKISTNDAGILFWFAANDNIRGNDVTNSSIVGIQEDPGFRDSMVYWNNVTNNNIQLFIAPQPPLPVNIQWSMMGKGSFWNPLPTPNPDPNPLLDPYVLLTGDVDVNGQVDIMDMSLVAKRFLKRWSEYDWMPYADLNGDLVTNIIDLAKVARNFGKTDP